MKVHVGVSEQSASACYESPSRRTAVADDSATNASTSMGSTRSSTQKAILEIGCRDYNESRPHTDPDIADHFDSERHRAGVSPTIFLNTIVK